MSNLNSLQKTELELLRCVLGICKNHNINYVMLGGTMLGAIRHRGFIPWDDDIDIGMPRADYERFMDIIKGLKYKNIRIENYKDQKVGDIKTYPLQIINTSYKIKVNTGSKMFDRYAWIDIFPLDGMPRNYIKRKVHMFRLLFNRCLLKLSQFDQVVKNLNDRPWHEKAIIKIAILCPFITKKLNERKYFDEIDCLLKRYSYEEHEYIVNFMGAYKFREMFPKRVYEETILYPFEDMMLPGCKDYDFYLSQMYGDYMKTPDDKDKNKHFIEVGK